METTHRRAVKLPAILSILVAIAFVSPARGGAQEPSSPSHDGLSNLDCLVREGIEHNPGVVAAREHWEALKRLPIQMRTLPDPQIQLQEFTVGSPKPSSGYETSDFYYTGFGASQDIPGPGKLRDSRKERRDCAASVRSSAATNCGKDPRELFRAFFTWRRP